MNQQNINITSAYYVFLMIENIFKGTRSEKHQETKLTNDRVIFQLHFATCSRFKRYETIPRLRQEWRNLRSRLHSSEEEFTNMYFPSPICKYHILYSVVYNERCVQIKRDSDLKFMSILSLICDAYEELLKPVTHVR